MFERIKKCKKKVLLSTLAAVIALTIVGVGGYFGYRHYSEVKAAERLQQEIQSQVSNASTKVQDFQSAEDRQAKLEILFNTKEECKAERFIDDSVKNAWSEAYGTMNEWFYQDYVNEYNSSSEGDLTNYDYGRIDQLKQYVENLQSLSKKIKEENDRYSTLTTEQFDEINKKISTMTEGLNAKINELQTKHDEEVAAQKAAEEKAKKEAEKKKKKKPQSNSGSSSKPNKGNGGSSGKPQSGGNGKKPSSVTWYEWQYILDDNGNKIPGSTTYFDQDGNVYDENWNYLYNVYTDLGVDRH